MGDLASPRQPRSDLEPLGFLLEHPGADCLFCRSVRQWFHLARLDLSGPCAPSPLAVSAFKAARLMTDPALGRPWPNTARPDQRPGAIRSVLCIYCRTDKFVYWPPASRSPSPDCPGCQRRINLASRDFNPAGTGGTTLTLVILPLSPAPWPASQPGTSARSPDVRCQVRSQAQAASAA